MAIERPPSAHAIAPTPPAEPVETPWPSPPVPGETEDAADDHRRGLIQKIVATLWEAVREGLLTPAPDGPFLWLPSRKAEPLLIERLKLERTMILRLGGVVPEVFLCQTRNKAHCYRIPAVLVGEDGESKGT